MLHPKNRKNRILGRTCGILAAAVLLATPVRVFGAGNDDSCLDAKIELYLIDEQIRELERAHNRGEVAALDYYERRIALEEQEQPHEAELDAVLRNPTQTLCSTHGDALYLANKQIKECAASVASTPKPRGEPGLANVAYYQRRMTLEERADDLRRKAQRIVWEDETEEEQGGATQAQRDILYQEFQNQEMQQMIARGLESGRFTQKKHDALLEETKKKARQLQTKESLRQEERAAIERHPAISEDQYSESFAAGERIKEIKKLLQKLEERFRAGEIASLAYWDEKRALQEERDMLSSLQKEVLGSVIRD